ncbi:MULTISPECIES: cobyrinic acid a,c-diamide synthase [Haloferax]|uniref:Cobyrinate a,c-diamide synthase n=1 Tax=Haloferax massiliensis TaxID=1476858 RepID=A0A0D6JVG6_9EURY|nr:MULTISPECIES: cobyrinic acid a,c-diamide synthase [Haloferax]MDS0242466.1 cobyrinic acid a,c-diamide synthase [Haloferax sp. S2CR25]MDS0445587.1 cobyrinic acid a,c-diamide synthase [Haloferax sp. S2CR25-2]CQR52868.1 Cobyrinic acid A,C-diamide synthase [Haloferax massiliensis]
MRGVVVAGTASGVGKTVTTLAVCRALEREGYEVQPAKAGPDFIDPSHHAAVVGKPSRSLDPWLEGDDGMRRTYARGEGDICVVEGMMGLYDGDTSTARVAALLDLPVVLVADARAGMQSVAATAYGFRTYADRMGIDADVAGVIASRAHGGRHAEGIRDALPEELPYLGRIPPSDDLEIPERHLGLHLGDEAPLSDEALDAAADGIRADALAAVAREPGWDTEEFEVGVRAEAARATDSDGPTVAVARDEAFCFVYPSTLDRLESLGAVSYFSPVAGDDLPDCDGVYLPGGYPERFAADLASSPTLPALADRAADGLPVFGECGGLMALSESLTTTDGDTHEMAGILPADVTMRERYQALDHVELRATDGTLTADAGETLRGHEFHYSSADPATDARFAFDVERGTGIDGREGLTEYRTLGTYAHVHPESGAFDRFVSRLTD